MRREVIKKHTKEREATGSDSLPRVRKVKGSPAGEGEELVDLPLRAGAAPAQWPLPFDSVCSVMNVTPASTSRRASRVLEPNRSRP